MTQDQVRTDISALHSYLSAREGKYIRNLNRYHTNGQRFDDIWSVYGQPYGYINIVMGPDGPDTVYNFSKSIVDAITSKISQAQVRPFFNPVNGDYKTRKIVRQAQQAFDALFEAQGVYSDGVYALRDALVFDHGAMWCDDITGQIKRINPWQYEIDPAEWQYDRVSRCAVRQKNYPLVALVADGRIKKDTSLWRLYETDRFTKREYAIYYDLKEGRRWEFYGDEYLADEEIKYTRVNGLMRPPVVQIWYNRPIKSYWTTSLMDDLYTLQWSHDAMMRRIDQASRRAIVRHDYVQEGSGLKATQLENGVTAYSVRTGPEGGVPVVSTTPPIINQQFFEARKMYEQSGFDMAGISQLSAQSKKPSGLDSGVALQTFEDIESDRFEVLLKQFVNMFVELAKMAMDVMPDDKDILPKNQMREPIKWSAMRKQREAIMVQFSAASSLSKDPAEKLKQINQLIAGGFIDKDMAASLLQLPDLENAYGHATVSWDYCQSIIENAIDKEDYDFIPTVSFEMLKKQIWTAMMRFDMAQDDTQVLKRLQNLLSAVTLMEEEVSAGQQPAPPPMPMPGPGVVANPLPPPTVPAPVPMGA